MGKGYQEATKLIAQLRARTYRKLNDDELLEFRKEMIDHMGGEQIFSFSNEYLTIPMDIMTKVVTIN